MSSDNSKIYTCKCGKTYKTRQPYIKHVGKCVISASMYNNQNNSENNSENIHIETVNDDNTQSIEQDNPPRIRKHLAPDAEYLAQIDNDMKNDIQEFINSNGRLPQHEPIEGENITVNTLVIETLLKTVLSQVLLHHHRHTQTIVDQNTKLIEENKMLLRILRTIMYTKNNIKYEIDIQSDDDNNSNKEEQDMNSYNDNNNENENDNNNDDDITIKS